jgi:hypothetical protein
MAGPGCPACGRLLRLRQGLNEEEVWWCPSHDYWYAEPLEDAPGPVYRWMAYGWRF